MAAKDNTSASQIDKTSFWWTGLCGICHTGGGPSEYDRDGHKYYDVATGEFGYEALGKTAAQVTLDGDYCEVSNSTGALRDAPWDVTGVSEPDCLLCHRLDRTINEGKNMNWIWRSGTMRRKDTLVDSAGGSVPAFAAAATAAQGWFSNIEMATVPTGKPPMATVLDIDYQVGVNNASLLEDADDGTLRINPANLASEPTDYACWGCHVTADTKKRGRTWFAAGDDVHYAAFNNLDDADPGNDIAPTASTGCAGCHPSGMDHNLAKGHSNLGSVRNDTDYVGFRTCRECHTPGVKKHPDATEPTSGIHTAGHLASMTCEMCHIPYKTTHAAQFIDNATTGSTMSWKTDTLTSADPLDPKSADKSRWYPSFINKTENDGVTRLAPAKLLLSLWWGDWDQNGTPGDFSDDQIKPIPLWRVRQITGGAALPGTLDDNGDGKPEVNQPFEIEAYITALMGNDSHGNQVAANPVLVKGEKVWFLDGTVQWFNYHTEGVHTEATHPFSVNHNVLPTTEALGSTGCTECHQFGGATPTPVFDREIPVSPFDETDSASPVYKTVRDLPGVDPN